MFKYPITQNDIDRFWKYVNVASENDCWIWTGTLDANGYGVYSAKRVLYKAHRVSYFLHHKSIDKNLMCCHSCDNPPCVNPNHLWLGTQGENSLDRHKKGRTRTGHLRGQDNPGAKLTENDVRFIRKNHNHCEFSTRKLAAMFGVCQTKIRQVLSGQAWKGVK